MSFELVTLNKKDGLVCAVAHGLGKMVHAPRLNYFSDGEMEVCFENPEQFAGKRVVLIQSTGALVHKNILQVAFAAHELKNAGAKTVVGVLPYFGYSRQEKSTIAGRSGSAQVIAQLFENAGIDELISVELHTPVLKSFFSIPVHDIVLHNLIAAHIKKDIGSRDICLIAPDAGAKDRVAAIAGILGVEFLIFEKQRYAPDKTSVVACVGLCRGKNAVIVDDIIDTGGTVLNVCAELKSMGFEKIYGYFVHPVFSGDAVEKIEKSKFEKVYVSNTLTLPIGKQSHKIEVFDVSTAILKFLAHII